MLDYIVVGLGLSGLAVSEELEKHGKSFVVFENDSQKSSYVAGGIYNPVILKRFTLAWNADKQLEQAIPFYRNIEKKLKIRVVNPWNIYRRFHSPEEQNDWFIAADNPKLSPFLASKVEKNTNKNLIADAMGKVCQTGNITTATLLDAYRTYLSDNNKLIPESFEYSECKLENGCVNYSEHKARNLIFCEGFGIKKNPWFGYLPLQGNKGEYIIIHSPDLKLEFAVKSSLFLMPLGNDLYKAGATYDNFDKSPVPTSTAREKLVKQLKTLIKCKFEVVDQVAGIRPSVGDRKPLIGRHPEIPNLYCCNGFGSRGVIIAPSMAPQLIEHIENNTTLSPEIDIKRFTGKHYKN